MTAPDWAAEARDVVYGIRWTEDATLIERTANALRAAYERGRRAGLEQAARIIEYAPYATATFRGDGTKELYWEREALTLMLRDIRALAGKGE